jgi:hypothetical protein
LLQTSSTKPQNASFKEVNALLHAYKRGKLRRPLKDELVQTLVNLCKESISICLIIDGLDECVDRLELLELLINLAIQNVNILITSTIEFDLSKVLANLARFKIVIDKTTISPDIELYINARFEREPKLKNLKKKNEIRELLLHKHDGM